MNHVECGQPQATDRNVVRRLIINADDFGLDVAVNEAVERACVEGVLTSTSLMVGAPAAQDAVARARRCPNLRVGLHLVLADGRAVLPAARIPALVDGHGEFGLNMVRAGVRFFFLAQVRRQLAAEIEAQFAAFAATGLPLDHVNAHKHFHLHPTVLGLLLKIGKRHGLSALRVPREPRFPGNAGLGQRLGLAPWLGYLERRAHRAGLVHNHHLFGLTASGQMNEAALLHAITILPAGINEIYLHPATRNHLRAPMADYDHRGEFRALLSPHVRTLLESRNIRPVGYADLAPVGTS